MRYPDKPQLPPVQIIREGDTMPRNRPPPGPPNEIFSTGTRPLSWKDRLVIVFAYAVGAIGAFLWLAVYVSNMGYL